MKPPSITFQLTTWFSLSVIGVGLLFAGVTYFHLRHELKLEQWERVHPEHPEFVLHGSYSKDEIDDIAGHILHISILVSIPLAAGAILFGWYLANKSLSPIKSINAQLQTIEAVNLNARVTTPDANGELQTITANINALLERIESSYRDVAEFSALVAHELRTPLTLMRLQLEDLSSRRDSNLSDSLQEELQRLEAYVDRCLLIARAERGQLDVKKESLDLHCLIEDIIEPFSLLAREENRAVVWKPSENFPVEAVGWIVKQILHNLLSNALKHGQGDIEISLARSTAEVVVNIRNQPKPSLHIGTGLGLRIVEALVRCHGSMKHESLSSETTYLARISFSLPLENDSLIHPQR